MPLRVAGRTSGTRLRGSAAASPFSSVTMPGTPARASVKAAMVGYSAQRNGVSVFVPSMAVMVTIRSPAAVRACSPAGIVRVAAPSPV